eukprot:477187_1
MADYVHIMFWIWIIYDFSINVLCVIPYLFGDVKSGRSGDKKVKWQWYCFFIGLLCIQLPTALLQLIMAWLDLNNDLLVFDSITMILCVWFALMIYQYRWMDIIRDWMDIIRNGMETDWDRLLRVLLFCAVGLCFILSIHSITLVPSDHFIWSLLLICIIIYSLLSLFFVVSVFRGLYADGSRILDIITLVATTILFLLQTIVALFQLDYLANASCSVPSDGTKYSQAQAMALLVLTVPQFVSVFDIVSYKVEDKDVKKIAMVSILIISVIQWTIMIHSVVFWSQDGISCDIENPPDVYGLG